jgi:hypothetical protein
MDPDANARFEALELRLTEQEEKTIRHDATLDAIRKLILTGMRMIVENRREFDGKIAALVDAQMKTEEAVKQTQESLKLMQDSMKRFFDRSGNGHKI